MKSAKTTVTLEDLLRIKRAEQPPKEYWVQFEQELRSKQLAAIVAPRPWWAPLIRAGAKVAHLQLPVGAAAILAVSLITIREYRTPMLDPVYVPSVAVERVLPESQVNVFSALSTVSATLALAVPSEKVESIESAEEYADSELTNDNPDLIAAAGLASVEREPSPSARYIAANLAAAQAADPTLMDDVFGSSPRHTQVRMPRRDPLTQVTAPGESRSSRLLATALPVNTGTSELVVGSNERVSRSLTEERMYDSISRVGLRGDRVAIKF